MKKSITTSKSSIILKKMIIATMSMVLFTNCDKDNHDSSTPPQTKDVAVTLMTNVTDPMIMSIKNDKSKMEYYGDRSDTGKPIAIRQVNFTDKDGLQTQGFFDANKKPIAIIAPNGVHFFIEWTNDTDFNLLAISADGNTQINTSGSIKSTSKSSVAAKNKHSNTRIGPLKLKPLPVNSFKKQTTASITGNYFTINKCGPFNTSPNMAWVNLRDGNGNFVRRLDLTMVDTGKFIFRVPSNAIPSVNIKDMIQATKTLIDGVCEISSNVPGSITIFGTAMCSSLSIALASTVIGAAVSAPFFAACEYSVLLLENHCTFKDILNAAPSGSIDVFDVTVYATPNIILNGVVAGIPQDSKTIDYVAPAQGPFPDISMNLDDKISVKSFILSPSTPLAGNDYNAVVDISCLNIGTVIKISIIGSDGYTDEISYTVTSSQTSDSFILTVPGGNVGVNDECTVEVSTLGSIVATRKAYLVFK